MPKEYIEREALIENLNKFAPEHYSSLINMLITKQPTADVVEVVRCKDCEFCSNHPTSDEAKMCINPKWSDEFYTLVQDNDFCSYGVRKDK